MPLLTAEQIDELRQIIQDGATALSVATLGDEVTDEELQRLVDEGYVDPEVLDDLVLNAFTYGQLMNRLPAARQMSFAQFSGYLRQNPVSLSGPEREAYKVAAQRAGTFCRGLGNRFSDELGRVVVNADAELARELREGIAGEVAESIVLREGRGTLVRRLREMSGQMTRDWTRIAATESHLAHQEGFFEDTVSRQGAGVMMAKVPDANACDACLAAYLGEDGKPAVHPASWWAAQGSNNVGRKKADWRAVLGAMHPWCFPSGQQVMTSRGEVPIEDVRVGEAVWTARGRWGNVTQAHKRFYQGPLVVFGWGKKTLACTPAHVLGDGSGQWQLADTIRDGGYLSEICGPDMKDRPSQAVQEGALVTVLLLLSPAGVPVAAVNFDGDFSFPVAQVNAVPPHQLVELERDTCAREEKLSHDFVGGLRPSDLGASAFPNSLVSLLGASNSFVSRGGQRFTLVGGEALHAEMLHFALCAKRDPHLLEALLDGTTAHPELAGYRQYGQLALHVHSVDSAVVQREFLSSQGLSLLGRKPGQPELFAFLGRSKFDPSFPQPFSDRSGPESGIAGDVTEGSLFLEVEADHLVGVHGKGQYERHTVSVNMVEFRGYVYNLSVAGDESYHVEGIPSKNCQCQLVEVPEGFEFDDEGSLVPREARVAESANLGEGEELVEKAYKLQGRRTFQGFEVSIENRIGSVRHWHDPATGEDGKTRFAVPYGYIRRTEGLDGEHVDVFLGSDETAETVYVIHQMKAPDFTEIDEQKVMLGFPNALEARRAYRAHYIDPRFFGGMTPMSVEEFRRKVYATADKPQMIKARPERSGQQLGLFTGQGGPFVGPRLGEWANAERTRHWTEKADFSGYSGEGGSIAGPVGTMGHQSPGRTAGANVLNTSPVTEWPPLMSRPERKKRRVTRRPSAGGVPSTDTALQHASERFDLVGTSRSDGGWANPPNNDQVQAERGEVEKDIGRAAVSGHRYREELAERQRRRVQDRRTPVLDENYQDYHRGSKLREDDDDE